MDIGAFNAKETVLFCPHDQKAFTSEQLNSLVPKGGTFGFDVIVEVGLALFVRCRNNQETMVELAAKNVCISEREISYLGRKFIIYLALAHRQSQRGLRDFMEPAKYLEQKINPDSHDVDEIIASIEAGSWQASNFEHIPLIVTYALIHWIFEYPLQSNGYGFPFDRPHLDFYRRLQMVHQLLGACPRIEAVAKSWKIETIFSIIFGQ